MLVEVGDTGPFFVVVRRSSFGQPESELSATPRDSCQTLDGGRTWWAHFEFTRINTPTILPKKIEEQLVLGGNRLRLGFVLSLEVSGR